LVCLHGFRQECCAAPAHGKLQFFIPHTHMYSWMFSAKGSIWLLEHYTNTHIMYCQWPARCIKPSGRSSRRLSMLWTR
jgi:hypothetical protein